MPNLDKLNWNKLKTELAEELRNRQLFTLADVKKLEQRGEFTAAILAVFRPALVSLYQKDKDDNRTRI